MPKREEGLISRADTANLLIGSTAPRDHIAILRTFEAAGFYPPTDFVVTPFDELVLSQYLANDRLSSEEMARIVTEAFERMNYKSIKVSKNEISIYFQALSGDEPGMRIEEGVGIATVGSFPKVRDRYNCLFTLKSIEKAQSRDESFPDYPDHKRVFAYEVAMRYLHDERPTDIPHASFVLTMMKLDLVEHGKLQDVKKAMRDALTEYETKYGYTGDPGLAEFRASLQGDIICKKFPIGHTSRLNAFMGKHISSLWLEVLMSGFDANDSWKPNDIFRVRKGSYVYKLARCYIMGGAGVVNRYMTRSFSRFGDIPEQLGSFIVHLAFGLRTSQTTYYDVESMEASRIRLWRVIKIEEAIDEALRLREEDFDDDYNALGDRFYETLIDEETEEMQRLEGQLHQWRINHPDVAFKEIISEILRENLLSLISKNTSLNDLLTSEPDLVKDSVRVAYYLSLRQFRLEFPGLPIPLTLEEIVSLFN